jgi:hypothetical protein
MTNQQKTLKPHSMTAPPSFIAPLFCLLLSIGMPVCAQVVQLSTKPYEDKLLLPIAPPAKSSVAIPMPIMASVQLEKGVRVDKQLRAYGQQTGWDLVWEGPDYVLDQSIVLQGDFEGSITTFLKGANEASARLRAVFYRGNKTVRVTEF